MLNGSLLLGHIVLYKMGQDFLDWMNKIYGRLETDDLSLKNNLWYTQNDTVNIELPTQTVQI